MIRRFVTVLTAAASITALTAALAPNAEAQEIQLTGPLAGAPALRHERLYRDGRFEIAPTVSFTLLDEYRRTIFVGARLNYNFTDYFAFGVWGAYGLSSTTNLTDEIDSTAPRDQFTRSQVAPNGPNVAGGSGATFTDQTAKLTYNIVPQFTFTPFRGKLALFQKIFVDTDAYIHAGIGFVGVKERANCGGSAAVSCSDPASFALASRTAPAWNFGLGLNFYANDFVSLGVEYRAFPFSWNRAGFDSRGFGTDAKFPDGKIDSQDRTFKFNQMITIAVGFSLPAKPKISD